MEIFMKKTLFIVSLLLLGFSIGTHAQDQTDLAFSYNRDTVYQGPFSPSMVFNRYERIKIWFPSKRFESLQKISCTEARSALEQNGTWNGNLADDGQCLEPGEAPDWATGNYLNFLSEKTQRKKTNP
jgi:hypothetical protein